MFIIDWVAANGEALAVALLAIHAAAVAVVNLTPTPKDDAFVAKAYKVIEILAGLLSPKFKK